jgi:Flp pilus assembly protein CpaB
MILMADKSIPTTTPDWQAAARRRTRFYVLVAVLLAAMFGVLVFQFFAQQQRVAPGEITSAVFAARDIESGAQLTGEMLEIRDVSLSAVPVSHLSFKEQAVGRVTLYPLVEGEVVLPEKLAGDQGGAVAQRCPSGKWCVSIPVAWFIAAPPDMAEGDRLEIASVLPGKKFEETGFIATEVQVVALPGGGESPAYVLAVDDQEALTLLYARANQFQLLVLLRPAGG